MPEFFYLKIWIAFYKDAQKSCYFSQEQRYNIVGVAINITKLL